MAKLHSKKRGKSRSRKPKVVEKTQDKHSDKQVQERILELAKKGTKPSQIGLVLKTEMGVGDVRAHLGGKRLVTFLKDEKVAGQYPQELLNLIRKAVDMRKHLKNNVTDKHNKVKLSHVESKIQRLVKYYRKEGVLPTGWKYDPQNAALLLK